MMKKVLTLTLLAGIIVFAACNSNKKDEAKEQAKLDSIAKVEEQAKLDSIQQAEIDALSAANEALRNSQSQSQTSSDKNNSKPKAIEDMTKEEQKEVAKGGRG